MYTLFVGKLWEEPTKKCRIENTGQPNLHSIHTWGQSKCPTGLSADFSPLFSSTAHSVMAMNAPSFVLCLPHNPLQYAPSLISQSYPSRRTYQLLTKATSGPTVSTIAFRPSPDPRSS
ncbi:unnamed protein product [Protopolystoma xenopodis]|uniref:Uncharacterized protein n=1 Tax=Protopolystoma xenopodis TaxID=117903 RepID=A0A3S5CQY9_9PLAT|nr:unnamed protein product [Protopolystoma xenopodis]